MHVLNVMFSRGLGGIEQSFLDYIEALQLSGHKVTVIISPGALVKAKLSDFSVEIFEVNNLGEWDMLAKSYIRKFVERVNPNIIIVHGNRAVQLLKNQVGNIPIIGVTHNYNTSKLIGLDAIFALTKSLKRKVVEEGQPRNRVFEIPNMIRVPSLNIKSEQAHYPPVIGTMGRFVKKKGFDVFIRSIAKLQDAGVEVKALIGGRGEEESNLKELVISLNLQDKVKFTGWVDDKQAFFKSIDVFCLPSSHEPFGIILLEAFIHGKPVVTTNSEGPSEIATDMLDSLVVMKDDHNAMASAIKRLLDDHRFASNLAFNALKTVRKYDIDNISKKINKAITLFSDEKQSVKVKELEMVF